MVSKNKKHTADDLLIAALKNVLLKSELQDVTALTMMPDTGLAHSHVWLTRSHNHDCVARVPKQSQMGLLVEENLAYQAACFKRAEKSGNTPILHHVIKPSSSEDSLLRGAFIVSAIQGRAPKLPQDLPAIANTLASIHTLPVPIKVNLAPLLAPTDPWQSMLEELNEQALYLDKSNISQLVRDKICDELAALVTWRQSEKEKKNSIECRLISFDAHPGNFLIQDDKRAILVDLEKFRYSLPGFDLAHASLYTSTTWDPLTYAELSLDDVRLFYQTWAESMKVHNVSYDQETLLQCRRAMWLWSITWCAKWSVENIQNNETLDGQNWSSELSEDSLVSHVAERVAHYLSEPIVLSICGEWQHLKQEGLFNGKA